MHPWAVIRGGLLGCSLGVFLALVLVAGATSALSVRPPDWGVALPSILTVSMVLACLLTGLALGAAWVMARRRAIVPWMLAPLGGAMGGTIAGALVGPWTILLLSGALGAATGALAWAIAFGWQGRVRFGPPG